MVVTFASIHTPAENCGFRLNPPSVGLPEQSTVARIPCNKHRALSWRVSESLVHWNRSSAFPLPLGSLLATSYRHVSAVPSPPAHADDDEECHLQVNHLNKIPVQKWSHKKSDAKCDWISKVTLQPTYHTFIIANCTDLSILPHQWTLAIATLWSRAALSFLVANLRFWNLLQPLKSSISAVCVRQARRFGFITAVLSKLKHNIWTKLHRSCSRRAGHL